MLTPENLPLLQELKKVTDILPEAPAALVTDVMEVCPGCGASKSILDFEAHNTGRVMARDELCRACAWANRSPHTCVLVCEPCRVIRLRMSTYKDKSGFEFQAGGFYHAQGCPKCLELGGDAALPVKIRELEDYKQAYGKH